ncbi:DUF1345 domain-containing protein [Nocardia inohanensis]|uniref:DUF1345 domain-containing protein n=1 Tax=Nocardia inohanensis TaxID=209246 RepID=UPI000B08361E|nr:DUF1345 domain-containing protein [Nocardia inohanensis]
MSMLRVVVSRVMEIGLVLVALAVLWAHDPNDWLLFWNVLAGLYVGIWVIRLLRNRREDDPEEWVDEIPGSWMASLAIGLVSAIGLVAVVSIVSADDERFGGTTKIIAAVAALLAWFLLHLGFAEQYARTYYSLLPDRALSFPGSERPNLLDFAYFAFTIGVSFAVSDVETRHRSIRTQVLVHAVIGFFYNAAVIGVAVGVVTGGRG